VTGAFQRYLRAKRTVDDRALDQRLVDELREALAARATAGDGPLRVLEAGAGIGTMISRLVDWEILPPGTTHYTAVDLQSENIAALPQYLRTWADGRKTSVVDADPLTLVGPDRRIEVEATDADVVAYAEQTEEPQDLVVGVALLDILGVSNLDSLVGTLGAGGVCYFPITFDGGTRFYPAHPADRSVEGHYHTHMDQKEGGSSRAGGEALARLQWLSGVNVDAAGSDWVVTPTDGSYPADEAYLLRHILDTIEAAVTEVTAGGFEPLDQWLTRRRAQVDAGELLYLTHQLDLLGQVDDPALLGRDTE
jgi:hypothetical protein